MIKDELTVMTREEFIPGVQNHTTTESPLHNMLIRLARSKMGPAGNGIRITDLIDEGTGRYYKGPDPSAPNYSEGMRARFVEWTNQMSDIVLLGTHLEENAGVPSDVLVNNQLRLSSFSSDNRDEMIVDYALTNTEVAANQSNSSRKDALHGRYTGNDVDRAPQSLADLFNENASYDNVATHELGTFPDGHLWSSSAPGQASTNIHEPRIFDNNGSSQTISKDILNKPRLRMEAAAQGFWLAGIHSTLYDTLSSEWDAQIQIMMGTDMLEFAFNAVMLGRTLYFPDDYMPPDRARHIHVGDLRTGLGGSYYFYFWQPRRTTRDVRSKPMGPMMPNLRQMPVGRTFAVPYYADQYDRLQGRADAVGAALRQKYTIICTHRWLQYEVRDLAP